MLHSRTQVRLLLREETDATCVMPSHPCPSTAASSLKVARRTCGSYKQLHYPHSAGQSQGGTKATTQGQEQPTTFLTRWRTPESQVLPCHAMCNYTLWIPASSVWDARAGCSQLHCYLQLPLASDGMRYTNRLHKKSALHNQHKVKALSASMLLLSSFLLGCALLCILYVMHLARCGAEGSHNSLQR